MTGRPADDPLFDRVILDQIREVGGEDLVLELFGIFVEHSEERLAGLRAAREAGDRDAAARVAHSIRSSASSVGARLLAERAGELERLARSADAPSLETAHGRLARQFAAVLDELGRRLAAAGRSA